MRMTKGRKAIYEVLENSTMPLTAGQIYDLVKASDEEIWLSTVYRNLEVFEKNDMVIKADIPHSDQYHYIASSKDHIHYAICLSCKNIIENLDCPMTGYKDSLDKLGFEIVDHRFIVYGYCKDCS